MKSLSAMIFFSSLAENPFSRRAELTSAYQIHTETHLSGLGPELADLMKLAFVDTRAEPIFQNSEGVF
jgi:hypothetical protein